MDPVSAIALASSVVGTVDKSVLVSMNECKALELHDKRFDKTSLACGRKDISLTKALNGCLIMNLANKFHRLLRRL